MNAPAEASLDPAKLFDKAPVLLLVVAPDSPRFTVLAVTDAYLRTTCKERGAVVGRALFEGAADDAEDLESVAFRNMAASLERALAGRVADVMPIERHDIQGAGPPGRRQERYWHAVTTPLVGPGGEVECLFIRLEDVTAQVLLKKKGVEHRALEDVLTRETEALQAMNLALRESRRAAVSLLDDAIGARQKAELAAAALSESEERFRVLVESTAAVYWECNVAGELMGEAPSWHVFTGQDAEEWRDGGWLQAVHPDDRERVISRWQETLQSGAPSVSVLRLRRADGAFRWMHATAAPVEAEDDGRVVKWVGMMIDVTDRRPPEQQAR